MKICVLNSATHMNITSIIEFSLKKFCNLDFSVHSNILARSFLQSTSSKFEEKDEEEDFLGKRI